MLFESPRQVEIKKGAFTDWFGPFEVHVYRSVAEAATEANQDQAAAGIPLGAGLRVALPIEPVLDPVLEFGFEDTIHMTGARDQFHGPVRADLLQGDDVKPAAGISVRP